VPSIQLSDHLPLVFDSEVAAAAVRKAQSTAAHTSA